MKFRPLNLENDYPRIKQIFEESKMAVAPNIFVLPADGVVVTDQAGNVKGSLFIYFTSNSNSVIVAYPLLSKEVEEGRDLIIKQMYDHAEYLAKAMGFKVSNTWSGLPHVQKTLKFRGYVEADKNVNQYMKRIG